VSKSKSEKSPCPLCGTVVEKLIGDDPTFDKLWLYEHKEPNT
jgi:hypothetical protein